MFFPLAHVKWFVEVSFDHATDPLAFSFNETPVQIWVGIIVAMVIIGSLFEKNLPLIPKKFLTLVQKKEPTLLYLFQLLIGLNLLANAYQGTFLTPHYEIASQSLFLALFQGFIGLLLVANIGVPIAGGLLLTSYLLASLLIGPKETVEYVNLLGVSIFLMAPKKPFALSTLRILTGAALIILAFTEKLFVPSLAMKLLEKYNLNFMPSLGFELFSDRLFVLSAGSAEALFGLIFILGIVTRINTVALAGFLISSNLYFAFIGHTEEALTELIGHLPIFATGIILLAYGSGKIPIKTPTK